MMGKRILSLCMALALCLALLPATALAADGDTVYVGGVALPGSTTTPAYAKTDDNGAVTTEDADESNYNIKWDGSTLTLRNANITGVSSTETLSMDVGIYAYSSSGDVSLEIELQGENEITSDGYGIWVYAPFTDASSLTITGSGSLDASGSRSGIQVQSNSGDATLTIQNADVTAQGGAYSSDSGVCVRAGTNADAFLAVDGGSLTASGNPGIFFDFGGSSVTGTPSLTVSNSALVDARDGGIGAGDVAALQPVSPEGGSTGIVFDNGAGTVYGSVTLREDLTIGTGESLTPDDGATLNAGVYNVIVDGGTLDDSLESSLGDSVKYTPAITTTNLSDGTVGTRYSATLAADGTTPITWSLATGSSLPSGLTLDKDTGVISGAPTADATATFTVTATNDYGSDSKEFTLTIQASSVNPVTDVTLDKSSLSLAVGESDTLTATIEPDNASNKAVTWSGDPSGVVEITPDANDSTKATVRAVKEGTATITVTTEDGSGKTDTCNVEVESNADAFEPAITAGAGGTWQRGSEEGLSFTSNAALADFVKVQVDGEDLAWADYEVREGSTIVTLNPAYLETLSVGRHTLAIVSNTGTATTEFTIQGASAVSGDTTSTAEGDTKAPQTGDASNTAGWSIALFVSAGIAGITVFGKRKKIKC